METLNPSHFDQFAAAITKTQGQVQALEWIPRVLGKERKLYETLVQQDGYPGYEIRERNGDDTLIRAKSREEYFPVHLVSPYESNEAAVGFDLASNPSRLSALEMARDTGDPTMTSRITLVQEQENQAGVLAFQALYEGGMRPETTQERREKLAGFALLVLRVDDTINSIIHDLPIKLDLEIFDITESEPGTRLYGNGKLYPPNFTVSYIKETAGRRWAITAHPADDTYDFQTPFAAWVTLVGSILLSGALATLTYLLQRENRRITVKVKQQTQRLELSEKRFKLAVDGAAVGLWDWNIESDSLFWSPKILDIIGVTDKAFVATSVDFDERLHPDDRDKVLSAVKDHITNRVPYDITYRLLRESGQYVWIHARGQALWNKKGKPVRMAGSMNDVTGKIKIEQALKKNQSELQFIFDNVPARIWYKDDKNNILRLNERAASSMGVRVKDVEGVSAFDLFPETAEKYYEDDLEVIKSGKPVLGLIEEYIPAGQERSWVRTDKIPFLDAETGEQRLLVVSTDITAERLAEEKLRKMEQRFALAASTMVDGMVIIDKRGIIQQVNPAVARMFEYDTEDLIGQNVKILMPEHFSREHDGYIKNYQDTNEAKIIGIGRRVTGKTQSGREFPMHLSVGDMNLFGESTGFVGIIRDITDEVRAEQELIRSEERFALAASTMVDGMVIIDPKGIIQQINPATAHMFEYDEEELIGQNVKMLMPEHFSREHDEYLENYHRTQIPKIIGIGRRVTGKTKSGREFPMHLSVGNMGMNGKTSGFVGIVRNISDEIKAEQDLLANMAELKRSNDDLEQFAYVASHDLKAPLRGIHNLADWIEENIQSSLDEETQGYMDMLKTRVDRLESLLGGLLEYSRVGSKDVPYSNIELNNMLAEIQALHVPAECGIKLEHDLPQVYLPYTELSQILQNLINNAIKHHDRGEGTIRVAYAPTDTHHVFSVTDDGPGIPEDMYDKVFMMFQTLRPRDEVEGSGMGLAIVKKLVERHDGNIWLEKPSPERGTTVFFSLMIKDLGEQI